MRRAFLLSAFVLFLCSAAFSQNLGPVGLRVGAKLPILSGVDLEGRPTDLSPQFGKGLIVLSFWSVNCTDCIRELDDLKAIRREFPPNEIAVVAINTDSAMSVERIASFVRRYEATSGALDVIHLLDRDTAILENLGVLYIPLLVVVDAAGNVSSVLSGYSSKDKARLSQAMEEGRVALGAWSEGLRGRLLTILRGPAPGGGSVEWGSFRVEEGLPLFGLYDSSGWIADAAGRKDRSVEAKRIESVVNDRLAAALMIEALSSVGVKISGPVILPSRRNGLEVPESPFVAGTPWKRFYDELKFSEIFKQEKKESYWIGDEYWAGLVGDVDLGALRKKLKEILFPDNPIRIRLDAVSDFNYKPLTLLKLLREKSYRLQSIQGEHLVYYGSAEIAAQELNSLTDLPFKIHVEVIDPDLIRVEVL